MKDVAATQKMPWARPTLQKMRAGAAEAGGDGINDGGPLGNARS